jgi:Uma2 family endonuclease
MSSTTLPPGLPVAPSPLRPTRGDTPIVEVPPSAHTLDGFREWVHAAALPPSCRVTYIAGKVLIDMSPERIGSHSAVKMEVSSVLYRLIREQGVGEFYPDGTLVSNRAADVSNEPDAIFVSRATFAAGRARLVPSADGRDFVEVEGSPDMVLEVVSPSSVGKDTVRLRERYHLAGVREYWLIDARGDDLQFDILRHSPAGYEPSPAGEAWLPSEVFGCQFRLDRVRSQQAVWTYTLHVAPLDPAA